MEFKVNIKYATVYTGAVRLLAAEVVFLAKSYRKHIDSTIYGINNALHHSLMASWPPFVCRASLQHSAFSAVH